MHTAAPHSPYLGHYPRLRRDLRISEQSTRDGAVYVVSEPDSGRFFRLGEVEYFITQQLDGTASPEEIRRRAEARFGSALSAEVLERFLGHARAIGLLESERAAMPAHAPRGRIRGDPLYLRLNAFNPSPYLDWLLPKLQFCFTRGFVYLSIGLMVLGFGVFVSNWTDIYQEFAQLLHVHAIILAWLILLVSVGAHEFAHALTCKHFGGQVREMGVMLIYLQPAVYCNVSEAWLFREKSKRLWVASAGPYWDLILWAFATLIWRVTDGASGVHFIALVVMVTTLGRTLFNVNPLIKLDAYYFLSDLVEVPNLRRRAFRYLSGLLRRLWGSGQTKTAASARERRIFIAYGLLAGTYSILLLGYVTYWAGHYLIDRYRGLGFLIFLGLFIMLFRHPLKQTLHALPEMLHADFSVPDAMKRRARWAIPAALGLVSLFPVTVTVPGDFTVLPTSNADVRPEVDGVIEEVYVKEGDTVAAGVPIARLSNRDRQAELAQVEADIREKQARLKMLRVGPRAEDIALARQRLETATTRVSEAHLRYGEARQQHAARLAAARADADKAAQQLKFAEQKFEQMQPLEGSGAISPLELKEAESDALVRRKGVEEARAVLQLEQAHNLQENRQDIALAEAGRQEAERELQLLMAGSRPEEIEAMEAELASLQARQSLLQDQIRHAWLLAPHPGVVATPHLKEKIGEHVDKGELVAEVHDLHKISAEIAVPERNIADVRVGQPVQLKAQAFPGETFHGVVTRIAPATTASDKPSIARVVRVTTVIDNPGGLLRSDMTGFAKIDSFDRPLIVALGRNLVRSLRTEVWSWW